MAINFEKFSLGKVLVTVKRYTGAYVDGVFVKTLGSTFTTWASAQPYETEEQGQMYPPAAGQYSDELLIMYTSERIYLNDKEVTGNPVSDIITVYGKDWKPIKVQPWQHLQLQHYEVLLQKHDGD